MKTKDTQYNVQKAIQKFKDSPTNQEIFRRFSTKTFFDVTRSSRMEQIHTNFLTWLFGQDWNISINNSPIYNLLKIAEKRAGKCEDHLPDGIIEILKTPKHIEGISVIECQTEYPCSTKKKNGRVDIFIKAGIIHSGKVTPITIVVENKVNCKEDKQNHQTWLYYTYISGDYKSSYKYDIKFQKNSKKKYQKEENECQIFLYLTAHSDMEIEEIFNQGLKHETCECLYFTHINYQDIMSYVLEPLMASIAQNDPRAFYLKDYMKILSFPYIEKTSETEKYYNTMAMSKNDRDLLVKFWKENSTLIRAALEALVEFTGESETDKSDFRELKENIDRFYAIRHSSDYAISYNDIEYYPYKKRWLAFNICKILADNGKFLTPADCPCKDYNGNNAILSNDEYTNMIKSSPSYKDRFTKLPNPLNNNECIYISNQWGIKNGVDPIDALKEWAKEFSIIIKNL